MNDATYITHELAYVHLMGVHKNKYILVTCPFWVVTQELTTKTPSSTSTGASTNTTLILGINYWGRHTWEIRINLN